MDSINSACNLFHNLIRTMKYCNAIKEEKELKNKKATEEKEDSVKHYVRYPTSDIWRRIYKDNYD